jgi:3-oxoacyl-[acyl-carrier-protein] synthase-1
MEHWRISGEEPLRANGLCGAMRDVAQRTGIAIDTVDFHASGMTGESWYAKEVSLSLSRVLERRKPKFPHHIVASRVGETGAAAAVLTLAWLADVMGRGIGSPGRSALLHFADDEGHRAALIVRHRI